MAKAELSNQIQISANHVAFSVFARRRKKLSESKTHKREIDTPTYHYAIQESNPAHPSYFDSVEGRNQMSCNVCNNIPCLCSLGEKLTGIKNTIDNHWRYKEASDNIINELWGLLYNICILGKPHLQFRFEEQVEKVERLNKSRLGEKEER